MRWSEARRGEARRREPSCESWSRGEWWGLRETYRREKDEESEVTERDDFAIVAVSTVSRVGTRHDFHRNNKRASKRVRELLVALTYLRTIKRERKTVRSRKG